MFVIDQNYLGIHSVLSVYKNKQSGDYYITMFTRPNNLNILEILLLCLVNKIKYSMSSIEMFTRAYTLGGIKY